MTGYGSTPAASPGSRTNGPAIASLTCGIIGMFPVLPALAASDGGFTWYVGG